MKVIVAIRKAFMVGDGHFYESGPPDTEHVPDTSERLHSALRSMYGSGVPADRLTGNRFMLPSGDLTTDLLTSRHPRTHGEAALAIHQQAGVPIPPPLYNDENEAQRARRGLHNSGIVGVTKDNNGVHAQIASIPTSHQIRSLVDIHENHAPNFTYEFSHPSSGRRVGYGNSMKYFHDNLAKIAGPQLSRKSLEIRVNLKKSTSSPTGQPYSFKNLLADRFNNAISGYEHMVHADHSTLPPVDKGNMRVYHSSPISNIPSILKNGIKISGEGKNPGGLIYDDHGVFVTDKPNNEFGPIEFAADIPVGSAKRSNSKPRMVVNRDILPHEIVGVIPKLMQHKLTIDDMNEIIDRQKAEGSLPTSQTKSISLPTGQNPLKVIVTFVKGVGKFSPYRPAPKYKQALSAYTGRGSGTPKAPQAPRQPQQSQGREEYPGIHNSCMCRIAVDDQGNKQWVLGPKACSNCAKLAGNYNMEQRQAQMQSQQQQQIEQEMPDQQGENAINTADYVG